MKRTLYLLLIIASLSSCAKRPITNHSDKNDQSQSQLQNDGENLVGKINKEIAQTVIENEAILILNGKEIDRTELELLNELRLTDFIEVKALTKDVAERIYGAKGKSGAILIIPFTDELLSSSFYEGLTNVLVVKTIKELESEGKINANPLLVINGVPLRGDEIAKRINSLGQDGISKIHLLEKNPAYSIYGIRAMNGVLLIDSQ